MTNDKSSVIKYKNSDRANFLAWKRTLCAALSTHPDKLLTVMTDKTLAKSVELKAAQCTVCLTSVKCHSCGG